MDGLYFALLSYNSLEFEEYDQIMDRLEEFFSEDWSYIYGNYIRDGEISVGFSVYDYDNISARIDSFEGFDKASLRLLITSPAKLNDLPHDLHEMCLVGLK